MRYGAEHKARTRARVLHETVKAIRAQGPASISVADMMGRAGLTHGGFYAHFASRDDLVLAAVAEMFGAARFVFEQRTQGLAPAEALRAYVGFYLSRTHRDCREGGCPLPVLSSDLPRMDDAVRARFTDGVARLTTAIQAKLEDLHHPDAEAQAGSALAEMIGALSIARATADPARSDAVLARSRVAILGRLGVTAAH